MGGGPAEPKREHLLCTLPFPEPKKITAKLREDFPFLTVTWCQLPKLVQGEDAGQSHSKTQELPKDLFKECTILFTLFILPKDIAESPNLKWVHFFSAGVNNAANSPVWAAKDVTLTTSSGVHGPQISEWVTMTTLTSSHRYNVLYEQQKEHKWDTANVDTIQDLVGQRLGVLGYGSIGRQTARVAKAMGMDVYAYTATPKETKESRRDQGFIVPGTGDAAGEYPSKWFSGLDKASLHDFLKQDLDILLVSVPLTKQTTHFLSTEEFDILSARKTFISNISRGPILDQPALIDALKAGKLRGAALDVTDPEPLPADSELWDMSNVIVTPHISGRGTTYADRSFMILSGNIAKREKGDKMWNVVDRERGY